MSLLRSVSLEGEGRGAKIRGRQLLWLELAAFGDFVQAPSDYAVENAEQFVGVLVILNNSWRAASIGMIRWSCAHYRIATVACFLALFYRERGTVVRRPMAGAYRLPGVLVPLAVGGKGLTSSAVTAKIV